MVFPEVEAGRVVGVAGEVEGIKVRWKISLLPFRYLKTGARLEEFDSPIASPYISLTHNCKVYFSQSKALSSSGRSSRREGGRHRGRRGVENPHHGPSSLPPPPCECVCTCGDPVPPKPVRRVMFSDESCSCSDDEKMKSLPVHMSSDSSTRGLGRSERLCCGPPSLPSRGQSARSLKEGERREVQVKEMEEMRRNEEESSGCCSASPVPSHYKSPKEVDGDYSYAYRYLLVLNITVSPENQKTPKRDKSHDYTWLRPLACRICPTVFINPLNLTKNGLKFESLGPRICNAKPFSSHCTCLKYGLEIIRKGIIPHISSLSKAIEK